MKTLTLQKAIEIGFDFENSTFENREELEQLVIEFLNDNVDLLERSEEDECNVHQSGRSQHVSYGDFESSGEIISWGPNLWNKPADYKIYHSYFLVIDQKTGEPYKMNLFEYVGENEYNTQRD